MTELERSSRRDALTMTASTAVGQRCLHCDATYDLYPPLPAGCTACRTETFLAPLEVVYDYPERADWLPDAPLPGLERYAPLLPPLVAGLSMGEGGTALVRVPGQESTGGFELYVKDESRNPTWSHKDRLNLIVTSAALAVGARGIVAASSGNHGAAAAAYAARAGLPAIILATPRPPAVASFLQAYGQVVVAVPDVEARWRLMAQIVEELGYHPASNHTQPPTNHPFGSEGYKTIAYELFLQLGRRAPEAVFLPTGYAELTFGVHKGFMELQRYGLIEQVPHIVACEPAAGGPLTRAMEQDQLVTTVPVGDTDAYAIAVPVNSLRGVVAVRESEGLAITLTDDEIGRAQTKLSRAGLWAEFSAAISYAGALRAGDMGLGQQGPIVCVSTSSGFKDSRVGNNPIPEIDGSWEAMRALLVDSGLVT